MRAGLNLNLSDLKQVGRPAALLCFVPACFEIAGMVLLAPKLLGVSLLDAAIMGAVVAAVSPAVVVPRMLALMEKRYGTAQGIPQMIMAGASVDDVLVIVLFTAFTGMAQGTQLTPMTLLQIPASILLGLLAGIGAGLLFARLFRLAHLRDSVKVLLLLGVSFLLVTLETILKTKLIPFSGLLAVMSLGIALQKRKAETAVRLSSKFSKLWVCAEVLLYVLVGATVDIKYAVSAGLTAVLAVLSALLFRTLGVFCCLLKTKLSGKERLFCMIAYLPKATVQAAIGSVPLRMGLPCGKIVLTVAVLSILITAPLGMDISYKRLLQKETEQDLQSIKIAGPAL